MKNNSKNIKQYELNSSIKTRIITVIIILIFAVQALAQFELKKSTINNGGTYMVSATFTMNASIGQVDANTKQVGANYSLNSGFWSDRVDASVTDIIFINGFE